ncbi:MAG: hypothetical protein ACI9X0_001416, partial [Kiritimatiellia bacterium]
EVASFSASTNFLAVFGLRQIPKPDAEKPSCTCP